MLRPRPRNKPAACGWLAPLFLAGLAVAAAGATARAAQVQIAEVTLVVGAATQVALPVSLAVGEHEMVSCLQCDLAYDAGRVRLTGVATGAAAVQSGKQVRWRAVGQGTIRLAVYGINQTRLSGGTLAVLNFELAGAAAAGRMPVTVLRPRASSPQAAAVTVTADDGAVTFAAMSAAASLAEARAYPNPFRPAAGAARVWFGPLTPACTIRIFKLSGELVKVIQRQDQGLAEWDVKNTAGRDLASGVYLYLITDSRGGSRRGKIVVIR